MHQSSTRLSIGIPAYNQGSFLRETLESTLSQDVPFYEVVVSNNHSTDITSEVLEQVQRDYPGRIRVVMPPQHLTMAQNWNFTASQLTGNWFSLLSSDDLAKSTFVRSVTAAISLSTDASLVRGAWENLFTDGRVEKRELLSVASVTRVPKSLYEQRFGPKCSFAAFALKNEVWRETGGFPEDVTLTGDWGMWLLAGALGDVCYAPEVIATYRMGHQSDVTRKRHHILVREMFTIYERILPRATEMAGLGRPKWILEASRTRFKAVLTDTSREYPPAERTQLVEAFTPWAHATGENALLARFERGDVIRAFKPPAFLLPMLRSMVSTARGAR